MTGRKKSGAGVEQLMVIQTASSVKHGAVWCMSVASSDSGLLVFSDDVTEDLDQFWSV